ncbi:MAG TPA: ABC transporter permease subunit [Chloroflexota bacterium]|nr:ABC transporter permease subunit [Chloroflexota bacterium]
MPVLTILLLSLREASRRKLLIAIAILTAVAVILSAWGFQHLLQIPCGSPGRRHPCSPLDNKIEAATLLVLLMFMFSFILALGAAFLAAPAIAGEVESGVALSMLARPIRRGDLVLGKWLGLVVLIFVYAALAAGLEFVVERLLIGYTATNSLFVILFLVAEAMITLTLSLALSTRLPAMTSGIIALVLFGMVWMGGVTGGVGAALHNRTIQDVGTVSSLVLPTDGLWRGAVYNLEPAALISIGQSSGEARANPFFVSQPPATAYLFWAAIWVTGVLSIGVWSFNRREL